MTTTNTAQGLLADIIEHPEADDLRLIFADWLDDHDEEERAEFIRVQVELANHPLCLSAYPGEHLLYPYCTGCRTVHRLYPRMEELWYAPVNGSGFGFANDEPKCMVATIGSPGPGVTLPQLVFRRGFAAEIRAPLAVLQQHLPALVRQHPIERVRATDREPRQYSDLGMPWTWWKAPCGDREARLPGEIWDCMEGFFDSTTENAKDYTTAEAAHTALSVALLKMARR